MTDKELIETLRGRNGFGWTEDAADRIEQLVKDIEVADDAINHWIVAYKNMEVKLAKAVAALRDVVSAKGLTDPTEYGYDAIKRARAVLEELENYNG
jgi:hypothetical protein